jgi:hypothetical protein
VDDYKVSRIYGSVRRTNPQVTKRGRQGRPSLWLFEQIKEEIAAAPDTVLQIADPPLLLRDRTSVDVERRPTARMSQQFLSDFDVDLRSTRISRMLGTSAFSVRTEFSVTTAGRERSMGTPNERPRPIYATMKNPYHMQDIHGIVFQ